MNHAPPVDRAEHSLAALSRLGHRIIDAFLSLWLFVSTGALFPLLASGGRADFDDDVSALLRLLLLPGVVIAPVLLWAKAREITALLLNNPLLITLLLWVWASAFWSIDPAISLRRALILTTNSIVTCYIVVSYQFNVIVRRLLWICMIQLGLSLIFAILFDNIAFMPDGGRLRGIFTHKSVLGQCLVISTLLLLLSYKKTIAPRLIIVAGFFLVFLLLIPTHSVTSSLLILLLFGLVGVLKIIELRPVVAISIMLLGFSAIGIVMLLAILFINEIMTLIGREITLTGRTGIWTFMLNYIDKRPLLGYGYRAFFADPLYSSYVQQVFLFDLTGSHNGYLETWLDIGAVGLVLLLAFLCVGFVNSIRRLFTNDDLAARFGFLWLVIYFARNIAESDLLSQSHLSWTLALLAVLLQGQGANFSDARNVRRSAGARS